MKIVAIMPVIVNARMRTWVFVKGETDEGITGWGEASLEWKTRGVAGCVEDLAPFLLGQDATRIERLWQVMYRQPFFRAGVEGMSALASIEQIQIDRCALARRGCRRAPRGAGWLYLSSRAPGIGRRD